MDLSRPYRASYALYKHQKALQDRLFGRAGRPVGGEAQTLRTLLAYLTQRFASRTPHTGKKSVQTNFQITANGLTATVKLSAGRRSPRSTRPKHPALSPLEQSLCQEMFQIF